MKLYKNIDTLHSLKMKYFYRKKFKVASLLCICLWCGAFGWYNKQIRCFEMHRTDNFKIRICLFYNSVSVSQSP